MTTTTARPPPEPLYTFRPFHYGPASSPHAPTQTDSQPAVNHIAFIHRPVHNTPATQTVLQLLTTDELGWVVLWSLEYKRVDVLWRPHPDASSFGGCLWAEAVVASMSSERAGKNSEGLEGSQSELYVVSQGRDHRFVLSRIPARPALTLNRAAVRPTTEHPSAEVQCVAECPTNALTFCKAALLPCNSGPSCIIAAPSAVDEKWVDIFDVRPHAPTPQINRIHRALGDQAGSEVTGPVISLSLYSPSGRPTMVLLLVGYENGAVTLWSVGHQDLTKGSWHRVGYFRGHEEPVFSVCMGVNFTNPCAATGWSVSADHRIVRYDVTPKAGQREATITATDGNPLSTNIGYELLPTVYPTRSPCRFDVKMRSDGKVMATASAGGKIWLYASPHPPLPSGSLAPLGLIKFKTSVDSQGGVLAFAPVLSPNQAKMFPADLDALDIPDSLGHRALLAAAGKGGTVVVWEVFPAS
ncbi:hypothetical protein CROQUDRAFT_677933 [Cronartium quercuum f. sp. fusiforme G11]|uniref:ASTRA-associated protein 1 n=1 Tax=Cronartium quercuum f. sp. fusiforme G11 TaxID=708437 RepID=A0A9P6TFE1_9BASI|nr:hypothetical protein CROQUDRAFT_677933 [Cronartium quercuum f. sp. fusiforme G11]